MVHYPLHQNASEADDGGLKYRRYSHLQAHAALFGIETDVRGTERENIVLSPHVCQGEDDAYELRGDGRHRDAHDPQAEAQDEQKVQHQVRHGGHRQKVEAGTAVPHRPHH